MKNKLRFCDEYPDHVHKIVNKWDKFLSPTSRKEIDLYCDCCGLYYKKRMIDFSLSVNSCPRCKSGVSFPERFFRNFLNYLNIQFSPQKTFDGVKYRYDFYFEHNNKTYTVETHGSHHYIINNLVGGTVGDLNNRKKIDLDKREFSESIGNTHIEIDCSKDDLKNLRLNIEGEFHKIFDLSTVNWKKLYMDSSESAFISVIKLYKNGDMSGKMIAKEVGVSGATVSRYISKYNSFDV
jgi:hypothetical protein